MPLFRPFSIVRPSGIGCLPLFALAGRAPLPAFSVRSPRTAQRPGVAIGEQRTSVMAGGPPVVPETMTTGGGAYPGHSGKL